MPIHRLPLLLASALVFGSGCVVPPREAVEVQPIPPRPLTAVALEPLPGDDGGFAGPVAMPPAPAGASFGGTHTVVRGDTLAGIARRNYGNPSAWKDIAAANPGIDPNRLKVGQVLMLP